jgi:hypothetical protein
MTDIYHITHIDNLPSIFKDGGLWCDNERRHQQATQVSIAYENLKIRRRSTPVNVSVGGVLADYVPFTSLHVPPCSTQSFTAMYPVSK